MHRSKKSMQCTMTRTEMKKKRLKQLNKTFDMNVKLNQDCICGLWIGDKKKSQYRRYQLQGGELLKGNDASDTWGCRHQIQLQSGL